MPVHAFKSVRKRQKKKIFQLDIPRLFCPDSDIVHSPKQKFKIRNKLTARSVERIDRCTKRQLEHDHP